LKGRRYTSGRIISRQQFRYGIFEMRAKLPHGRGTWSAFWLLSAKRPLNWPRDGEIGNLLLYLTSLVLNRISFICLKGFGIIL